MKKQASEFFGRLAAILFAATLTSSPAMALGQNVAGAPNPGFPTREEHAKDKENMLTIHRALMAYREDQGELPDWLSDLFPKYLSDTNVLVSPYFLRTGRDVLFGNGDPKLKTSYIYDFSGNTIPPAIHGAFPHLDPNATMKEWKKKQTEEFGEVVPVLRCFLYNPVLSVTLDGEFFESGAFWETDPVVMELRKKRREARSESPAEEADP